MCRVWTLTCRVLVTLQVPGLRPGQTRHNLSPAFPGAVVTASVIFGAGCNRVNYRTYLLKGVKPSLSSVRVRCVQIQHALSLPFSERGGETNTVAALKLLHSSVFTAGRGDRQGVPNIGVVVTDGHSTVQADRTRTEAETARQRGIELYAVGVGDDANLVELNVIASPPSSDYVVVMGSDSTNAAETALDELCR